MPVEFHPCDHPIRTFVAPNLLQIAMPMGGIGTGCACLNGYGGLQDFALRGQPGNSALPDTHGVDQGAFALLHIKAREGAAAITRLIEGPLPPEKIYDQGLQSQGYRHCGHEGLPRFASATFEAAYPFGRVRLSDPKLPISVAVTGFNPFIPLDDRNSGIPCAILEYAIHNCSDHDVEYEFSFHSTHFARAADGNWAKTRNAVMEGFGVHLYNDLPPEDAAFGGTAVGFIDLASASDEPKFKAMWFRGGWFDAISTVWREVSRGCFQPNTGNESKDIGGRNGGSIMMGGRLAAGESMTIPVVMTWYFPSRNDSYVTAPAPEKKVPLATSGSCAAGDGCCGGDAPKAPLWRPFYATIWKDAADVARYVRENYRTLRRRTIAFQQAMISSTVPPEMLDAVTSNLAILKTPTLQRQASGNVWGWEGCFPTTGCCPGSCTHVWNYAQSMPHLFPQLERTLREQELLRSLDEDGNAHFRSALPDGPASRVCMAAADGQLGGIIKLHRDWHISGDDQWLARLYPAARRSMEFCIGRWDPQRLGALIEPHHNTYDVDLWGPDGMCGSIYVAALAAMADLARASGDDDAARDYQELSNRAARYLDEELFNGDYYAQKVMWTGLRDRSVLDTIDAPDTHPEHAALLRTEGPKYQYGNGCLANGVMGAWMARVCGVETALNPANVRRSLEMTFKYNFRPDLSEHACLQRPGYAHGHEAGLVICTWPLGGMPTIPFPYSDEVWTGIEYLLASHMIHEGALDAAMTLVRAVRSRHEGHVRNPFNEYECGGYYARAMSSYALLPAFSGFRYSAVERTLWLAPRTTVRPFQTFFSTASGFGTLKLDASNTLEIMLIEGTLGIRRVAIETAGASYDISIDAVATDTAPLRIAPQ